MKSVRETQHCYSIGLVNSGLYITAIQRTHISVFSVSSLSEFCDVPVAGICWICRVLLETRWGLAHEGPAGGEDALKTEEESISARLPLRAALWRRLRLRDASSP